MSSSYCNRFSRFTIGTNITVNTILKHIFKQFSINVIIYKQLKLNGKNKSDSVSMNKI